MTIYTHEQAFKASLQYFGGDELATRSFLDKYALRDNDNNILEKTPDMMHRRMAKEFARIEKDKFEKPLSEDEIFDLFDKFRYIIPQGSPMSGIGNDFQTVSLSNCFLLDVPLDSYSSILRVDEQLVSISKRRGGVGIDLSSLRPEGAATHNAARTSTGIATWMERYSHSIREVGQSGRRGALMLTLDIHHPDIIKFVTIKNDPTKVTGANISVRLSKEFLDAVKTNGEYELRFPVDYRDKGIKPSFSKMVKAKDVWNTIIHSVWTRAEPGLLMWHNILSYGPADCYPAYVSRSTNPCVAPETLLLTKNGNKIISSIVGQQVEVWNGDCWSKTTVTKTGVNQPLLKVILRDGSNLDCTPYHKWYVDMDNRVIGSDACKDSDEILKQTIDLKPGDKVRRHSVNYTNDYHSDSLVEVEAIIDLGRRDDTYCVNEPINHKAVFNGILTGQCSEIPLSPLDSCRLLCINLFSYVQDPFTPQAKFDYNLFHKHSKFAQRLMDDLVDLESEKIDKIISKINSDPEPLEIKQNELEMWKRIKIHNDEGRRTGTGITALGDTLAALGIRYGSDQSISETESIYRALKLACYESSVDMAEELGSFKGYDPKTEEANPFIQRLAEEDLGLYKRMMVHGRRNIALTTTAPAGTVSILTQTTSGIEPLFMLGYTRRKKIDHNDKTTHVDFTDDNGDKWQEFTVYHPKINDWTKASGEVDPKRSPWICAEDVNWVSRVALQAAAQKHVCHAISVTINLPEDVKEEEVAKIYETASDSGCKGITVYRKNCRSGVLIENKSEPKPKSSARICKSVAPKRPRDLPADVFYFTAKGDPYYVVVGLLDGDPYEVFVGSNKPDSDDKQDDHSFHIPKTIAHGKLTKESRGHYRLTNGDLSFVLDNGHSDPNANALTRMISTALRHGSDISFVVHQLEKTEGDMTCFAKVLSRALKKYVKDGTKVSGEVCECGGELVRESGCRICKSCGASFCG